MTETCFRCGDRMDRTGSNLCGTCEIGIQTTKLMDGVRCDRCGGHGSIYGTYCDIQRATNGRDTLCPDCHGSGRVAWDPDPEDVHPDLRFQFGLMTENGGKTE